VTGLRAYFVQITRNHDITPMGGNANTQIRAMQSYDRLKLEKSKQN